MNVHLPPDLHHCISGGRSIFLDVGRNRYFGVGAPFEECLRQLVAGRELATSDPDVRELVREGVLVASNRRPASCLNRQSAVPKASVYADQLSPPVGRATIRLLARRALVIAVLRTGSLKSILARRVARKQEVASRRSPPAAAIGLIV